MAFINLNDIKLTDLTQLAVAPSASNMDRSYGRRFTVTIGDDTQEVVFKDLYQTARRLMKEAKFSSIKDLKEVNAFISKLEGVEKEAIVTYKARGDWYKFRSWFHRFFGGSFGGSHLDRLAKLHEKLLLGAKKDFSTFLKTYSHDFTALSKGIEVEIEGKKFHVEWTKNSETEGTLHIWDKSKPLDKATCELTLNKVTYQNFNTLTALIVPLFYSIGQLIIEESAALRDDFMKDFKSFQAMYPDYRILQEPIKIDGKIYSVNVYGNPPQLIIANDYGDDFLEIQDGKSSYNGIPDGIPVEFRPVLSQIQRTMEEKKLEMATLGSCLNVYDDLEYFIRSVALLNNQFGYKKFTIIVNASPFDVWRSDNNLNFQDKNKKGSNLGLLQIEITNCGIKFEGVDVTAIPEEMKRSFDTVVLETYKRSSSYRMSGTTMNINVLRDGLDLMPEWHLNQLCSSGWETLKITYQGEQGFDLGGLKRDYIGKLVSSLSTRESLFGVADGSLKIPRVLGNAKSGILYCDHRQQEIYQNFGKLLLRCYNSISSQFDNYERDLITTGRLFSDVIFKVAFSLSENDLTVPFSQQKDAQISLAKTILTYIDKKSSDNVKNVIKCFELLEKNNLKTVLQTPDRSNEIQYAFYMLDETVRESYEDDAFGPDFEKIKANQDQFNNDLFNALMKDSTTVGELNGISIGSMIDPIYHMTMGMKGQLDLIGSVGVEAFSSKVQGAIDKDTVIASIETRSYESTLKRKVQWLKEWLGEASDIEIQSFLKFATGSASLASKRKIIIDSYNNTPFIKVSTCDMNIHISNDMQYRGWGVDTWDDTKESFIRNLKASISQEGFQSL